VSGSVCPAATLAMASATARPDAGLGRRGMAHEEGAILDFGRSHDLEIILEAEISDRDLAQADDGQRGGLHAADTDNAADAAGEQRPRCRAGQRQVEVWSACWRATAA
jgi:hypothetical protein